jgi:hypothetical protein
MPNSITLKGFKEFEAKLRNLPAALTKEVDFVVQDAGSTWEERAKLDAPTDQGRLRGAITNKRTGLMGNEITSPVEYSAYIEWGTKTRVQVPAELQGYAAQFRGGKGAGNAKEMIYAWMDRVGIPKERQWIIFISIITKGIHPHPFFFIQRPIIEKQLISDIKHILSVQR